MYVMAKEGDSPEVLALKDSIEKGWQRTRRLKKALDASIKQESLFRAKLRLLQESLLEGEVLFTGNGQQRGVLEVSGDYPYLWLRVLGKDDVLGSRRLKFEEGTRVRRTAA